MLDSVAATSVDSSPKMDDPARLPRWLLKVPTGALVLGDCLRSSVSEGTACFGGGSLPQLNQFVMVRDRLEMVGGVTFGRMSHRVAVIADILGRLCSRNLFGPQE